MDAYANGYRDALKDQIEYHGRQARHYRRQYRGAATIELADRRVALRLHEGEVERLQKSLEDLDQAATPILMPSG